MSDPPPAILIADSRALDFLNSIATPADTAVDWISDGTGLMSWFRQTGLVPSDVLKALQAEAMPGELDAVAAQARALREWFREFVLRHKGRPLNARHLAELEPLNKLLQRDEAFYQISAGRRTGPGALLGQMTRRWRSPDSLLLPLGETLAKFVCEENFVDIKACEGAQCTLLFADHTRARARRWCSMGICGNRAKVAAHRQRLKVAH
ncbi:MAG TPA: CGNR zinc finger domain-containing protein [Steroidobacteraceae bacterium]|jgi:predicted RNA-binding Zn ribbon-like protein